MADELATVLELQARLDWVLDDETEYGVAEGAIADLSEDARFYGSDDWDSTNAPRQVKSLVLRAAARFMRNPDGYTQSRAGDETLTWADQGVNAGTAFFSAKEQLMLATIAGDDVSGFYSVPMEAWGPSRPSGPGYVPVDGAGFAGTPKPFPFYEDPETYW